MSNTGVTSKHIAKNSGIPLAKIRRWVKLGKFADLGLKRKRAFYFHDLNDSTARAIELEKEELGIIEPPGHPDIFEVIDNETSQGIADLREREELKSLVIKNRKHAEQYVLVAEHDDVLKTLAIEIRNHLEALPSRLVAAVSTPGLDKQVYDFCVRELEVLYAKIKKLTG